MNDLISAANMANPASNSIMIVGPKVLEEPIKLEDGDKLYINGDVTVKATCPVIAKGTVTIIGTEGSRLTLINDSKRQPCIGPETFDGMSFGRWSYSGHKVLAKIILENIDIICRPKNNAFSLGSYGDDYVPEIECTNASILCPEKEGNRVLLKPFRKEAGTTKLSTDPEYCIAKPGQTIPRPNGWSELQEEAKSLGYDLTVWDNVNTNFFVLKEILKFYREGISIHEMNLIESNWTSEEVKYALSAYLTGMPPKEIKIIRDRFSGHTGGILEIYWFSAIREYFIETLHAEEYRKFKKENKHLSKEGTCNGNNEYLFLVELFEKEIGDTVEAVSTASDQSLKKWWELIDPYALSVWQGLRRDICSYYLRTTYPL